jgi:predicted Zn finger-like uncharacterized protein
MEIRCDNCNAKLNIPDDKIPKGRSVTVNCPKCKTKTTVNPVESPDTGASSGVDAQAAPAKGKTSSQKAYEAEGKSPEFFEMGTKLVLLAMDDLVEGDKTREALTELGYKYVAAESTNQAISKMRFHNFDLVLISDPFDSIELNQSPILQYLNRLPMSIRRKMFVALMGDSFSTMDQMAAFMMSANVVINNRDMDKLAGILKSAISDNQQFYKVFMDTMAETGRG